MTLVVAMIGRESIWMLADRQLSTSMGKILDANAIKIMRLDKPDSVALLGYAGLGATPKKMQA